MTFKSVVPRPPWQRVPQLCYNCAPDPRGPGDFVPQPESDVQARPMTLALTLVLALVPIFVQGKTFRIAGIYPAGRLHDSLNTIGPQAICISHAAVEEA